MKFTTKSLGLKSLVKNLVKNNKSKDPINEDIKSKEGFKVDLLHKKIEEVHFKVADFNMQNKVNPIISLKESVNLSNTFVSENLYGNIPGIGAISYENFYRKIDAGNNGFSCPLDITRIFIKYENIGEVNFRNSTISNFLAHICYENYDDEIPWFYKDKEAYLDNIVIVKNVEGKVYIPEYDFDGIGSMSHGQSYQIKTKKGFHYKVSGVPYEKVEQFNDFKWEIMASRNIELEKANWYDFGIPSLTALDPIEFFKQHNEKSNVVAGVDSYGYNYYPLILLKDIKGKAYLPQWSFNGIGDLKPGFYYQIRIIFYNYDNIY